MNKQEKIKTIKNAKMQKSISAKVYTRKIFNSSHSANTSHGALVHCTDLHQPTSILL